MIRHLILVTFRQFQRNKGAFLVPFASLAIGITGLLFILLWLNDEWQKDKFHDNRDRLFQVLLQWKGADEITTNAFTHGPLAALLKESVPEVAASANLIHWFDQFDVTVGEENYPIRGYYAGPAFFEVFDFPMLSGNPAGILKNPNEIVLSEAAAARFFGTADKALGQTIRLDGRDDLLVSGIFENVPANSTLQFDFIASYEKFIQNPRNAHRDTWSTVGPHTMLTLVEGADPKAVAKKIDQVIQTKFEEPLDFSVVLQPFADRYLYGEYQNGQIAGGRIVYVRLFALTGLFLLLISCINFVNLSVAQGFRRARGIAVKKTIGVKKSSLILQYLLESISFSMLAVLTALALVYLLLPYFHELTGKTAAFSLSLGWLLVLSAITLLTGLLAGSYPAFYLAAFQPVKVLKGELGGIRRAGGLRSVLVVFQFAVAIAMMIAVVVVYRQIQFVQNKQLGYNRDNLIQFILNIENREQINTFVEQAKNIPGLSHISSGHTPINHQNRTNIVDWAGKDPAAEPGFYLYSAYYDLPETLGFQLKQGRTFFKTETSGKALLNETAAKVMGFEQALGQAITIGSDQNLEVVGIVSDFHFRSLHESIEPVIIRSMPNASPSLIARLEKGKEESALAGLKQLFERFSPGTAFDYTFIDRQYQAQYAAEQQVSRLARLFAALAILVSCLGLFGLAKLSSEQRTKEIGIRKVLGASTVGIVGLLSKDLLKLVVIALFMASPVAWYFMEKWLQDFAYRIDIQWWVFAAAGLSAILIAFLTVGIQSIKAALTNPVKTLRSE